MFFKDSQKSMLVCLLAASQFLILFDYLILMPLGPVLISQEGFNSQEFASLISIYSLGAIVFGIGLAGYLDRFNRKHELQLVLLLFMLTSLLHNLAGNYWQLAALRFVAGGLAGICGSLVMSVVSDGFDSSRRGRVIGIVLSSTSLVQIIGIPTGLLIAERFGWRVPFALNSILAILVTLGLLNIKISNPDSNSLGNNGSQSSLRQMLELVRQPFHFKAMLCSLLTMFSGTVIIPFLPLVLVYQHGIAESDLGTVYFIGGITAFVLSLATGRLAEIGNGRRAIFLLFPLGLIPLSVFMILGSLPFAFVAGIFAILNALYLVRMIPLNRFVLDFIKPQYLGGFQSLNTALFHVGASLAAWVGGIIVKVDGDQITGFPFSGVLSVLTLVVLLLLVHLGFSAPKTPHPDKLE